MKNNIKKQFLRIGDKPILFYSLHIFEQCHLIDDVILVVHQDDLAFVAQDIVDQYNFRKVRRIISGGAERQDSVFCGLQATEKKTDIVLIHDGVRPFISVNLVERGIHKCLENGSAVCAIPVSSTIKKAKDKFILSTIDRSELWEIQTPQIFKFESIYIAYEDAIKNNFAATDDAMMLERMGENVFIFEGDKNNIKITTPEDFQYANFLIEKGLV
jgi:2-C-methyl-D-erythritol 4-phosphate cytidylyltransferase